MNIKTLTALTAVSMIALGSTYALASSTDTETAAFTLSGKTAPLATVNRTNMQIASSDGDGKHDDGKGEGADGDYDGDNDHGKDSDD